MWKIVSKSRHHSSCSNCDELPLLWTRCNLTEESGACVAARRPLAVGRSVGSDKHYLQDLDSGPRWWTGITAYSNRHLHGASGYSKRFDCLDSVRFVHKEWALYYGSYYFLLQQVTVCFLFRVFLFGETKMKSGTPENVEEPSLNGRPPLK